MWHPKLWTKLSSKNIWNLPCSEGVSCNASLIQIPLRCKWYYHHSLDKESKAQGVNSTANMKCTFFFQTWLYRPHALSINPSISQRDWGCPSPDSVIPGVAERGSCSSSGQGCESQMQTRPGAGRIPSPQTAGRVLGLSSVSSAPWLSGFLSSQQLTAQNSAVHTQKPHSTVKFHMSYICKPHMKP